MKPRTFTRSPDGAMLGGVCTGIGRAYDVNPMVIRLIFVLLTAFGGLGVLAYLALWIVAPATGAEDEAGAAGATEAATTAAAVSASRAELDEAARHAAEAARHAAEAARAAAVVAIAAADQLARSTIEALRLDPAPAHPPPATHPPPAASAQPAPSAEAPGPGEPPAQ